MPGQSVLEQAEVAFKEGQPAVAAALLEELLRSASEPSNDDPPVVIPLEIRILARYRQAAILETMPGRSLEAVRAFEAFLAAADSTTPPRLIQVAEAEIRRLRGLQGNVALWDLRLELAQKVRSLAWQERQAVYQSSLARASRDEERLIVWQLYAEDAFFEAEWQEMVASQEQALHLQRRLAGEGRAQPVSQEQLDVLRQGRRELRRMALAKVAWTLVVVGALAYVLLRRVLQRRMRASAGGPPQQEAYRPDRNPLRGALRRLSLQWLLVLLVLYALYWAGRNTGEVSPVTLWRFGALFAVTGGMQAAGLAWQWLLTTLVMNVSRWLALMPGLLLHLAGLYLFCYYADYVSVLGL